MSQKCSGIEKFLVIKVSRFCRIFFLTSPKVIVSELFCVSELFWYQKFLDNKGITILLVVFVSECGNFCGKPFNDLDKLGLL